MVTNGYESRPSAWLEKTTAPSFCPEPLRFELTHGQFAQRTPQPPPVEQLSPTDTLLLPPAPPFTPNVENFLLTSAPLHSGQTISSLEEALRTQYSKKAPQSEQTYSYNGIDSPRSIELHGVPHHEGDAHRRNLTQIQPIL